MSILSKEEAKQILEKALKYSKAENCIVTINGSNSGNVRYARNTITTSGMRSTLTLGVQSSFGKKTGTTTITEFDDKSLEKVIRRSEELAKLSPENPEYMPPMGPQQYKDSPTFVKSTADITPEYRAKVAFDSIEPAAKKDVTAAGFLNDSAGFNAMMNSKGLFAYNQSTNVNFSVTMRTNDGTGSGWVTRDYNDVNKFNSARASQIALDKSLLSRKPKAIEPGKYTVILEPVAAGALIGNMIGNMGARQADEGRSFLSKKGGGNKLGEKLVDERITIYTDPWNTEVPAGTWDGNGLPVQKRTWIEKGVVKNMFYSRYWAKKTGKEYTSGPSNGIMLGGDATTEELIKSIQSKSS